MLYYFKKGKNTIEMQKKIVQCMEKVLWLIAYVKSGLQSFAGHFLLDDVLWLGRLFEVDSDQIEMLTENNQCYIMKEIADILKISKSIKSLMKRKKVSLTLQKKTKRNFWQSQYCNRLNEEDIRICPGWCGSMDRVLVCKPKGHWFDSQSGNMPGLGARSPVWIVWEATIHWCFSPFLSPSLPLSLKIN